MMMLLILMTFTINADNDDIQDYDAADDISYNVLCM